MRAVVLKIPPHRSGGKVIAGHFQPVHSRLSIFAQPA